MSTLHYRCSFDLIPEQRERSWEMLLKEIRTWIAKRPEPDKEDDFWNAWFFQGGSWKSRKRPGIRVSTRYCAGDCTAQNPNCWATEYEHPCDESAKCRFWRVHIGIEQIAPHAFRLSCQTLYYMRPGYIGLEPKAPLPTPPGLITSLLRSSSWRCMAGPEELRATTRILRVGEGHLFVKLLTNDERTCPVVLMSQIYPNKRYPLNGARLAKPLAGTAIVYQSESSEVDEELDNLLGEQFSCRKGAIRVYVPGFDLSRAGEERRHRFILPNHIDEWGLDKTIDIIVGGIARRSIRPKGVLTPLDVEAVSRQRRLVQLRARADKSSASKDEYMQLLGMLDEENKALKAEKARLKAEKSSLEDQINSLEDDLRRSEYDKDALKASLAQANVVVDQSKLEAVLGNMKELPKTLSEVVETIKAIHGERIAFTERAVKSAQEATSVDVSTAWKALWDMATILHDLLLNQEGGDKQKKFRDQSGFQLALTEGKLTNQDRKLTSLRKDIFRGHEIDITPHVKFDRGNTRAYFCPFQQNGTKLIVVGHIGDHLDTAGTRRQKR